jgi:hypothetical protein
MSTHADRVTREQWATLLDEVDRATFGELVDAVADARMIDADPEATVEAATDEGPLVVDDEASGMFDVFALDASPDDTDTSGDSLAQPTNDKTTREEPDCADATPGFETGEPAINTPDSGENTERALEAFGAAVEFFHSRLDADLSGIDAVEYDTPREAFREGRGWADDTIDEKRLGWAPASDGALLNHLMREGFDREAILSTGLFWDNLSPIWKGRFVLPYFDDEGRPAFAISRRAGDGHPADHAGDYSDDDEPADPAKYHKVPVSAIDECVLDEPIYGVESIDPDEPVLITEGVADAITAHQAGYPCLSPVTTSFKLGDRERLAELLDDAGVSTAFVVNDAEPPTSSLRDGDDDREGWDRLHIEQYGEGVRGAVRTASHLADDGIDARIGELPQPAGEKVDLDDYLARWDGDLRPVLARARAARDHPAYDPKRQAIEAARESATFDRDHDDSGSTTNGSNLYDLGIDEVAGVDIDYRGPSPLGHHGDSENYFVLVESVGLAYDHKYKKAYTPLTYLLADAGERDAARPNGSLDDSEHFAAWKRAKEIGVLPSTDPIPRRALRHIAREATEWDGELVEHETGDGDTFEGLPADVYNAALDAVEDRHGIDPARRPTSGTAGAGDPEHTAVLPPAIRDLSTATSGWDWRHAAEQPTDGLTVDEARERTTEAIADAYGSGDRVLIEALPTMGKSYGAIQAAANTGEPVTVLTGRGHKEQYEQFKQWCEEQGLTYYQLPSFARDCETANGEFGQEWADTVNGWYRRGATPKMIHKAAENVLGESLPCQCDGHQCTYTSKWDFDPDDIDVLIGHYSHAYRADKVVNGRTVVFDEFPSAYETEIGPELQGAVSYWLNTTPGIPFDSWTDLLEHRDDEERRGEALLWFEEVGLEADEGHVFDDAKAHAAAPLAVYALLAGDDLGNGFEAADLSNVGTAAFDRDRGSVTVLRPPTLQYASAVVGLDGTPTKDMWELSLGERLNHRPVLQPEERSEYIREALNLNLIRTAEYVKPYNSPDHVNVEADAALLEAITENHDERPGVITTTTAESEYESGGALEYVADTKHYGNVLGSNEFKAKRVGAVIGSNHYGDDYLKKWGAYAGVTVDRDDEKGAGLSYGTFGDKILTHMREHDTLQAAMRFGRDAGGAVVYVHTDTLPEWVPIADEGRVVRTWSDGLRGVIDAVDELGSATTAEIVEHDAVDVSRQQVFNHLETLRDRGVLSREQDPDDGRRVVWCDDELHRVGEHGEVDLGSADFSDLDEEEVRQVARSTIYTWDLTNRPPDPGGRGGRSSVRQFAGDDAPSSDGDPPPERFRAGD